MKSIRLPAVVLFSTLFIVSAGCIRIFPGEMAVATPSAEALELFTDGREMADNFHFDAALQNFQQAIEIDSNFAMAHLYIGMMSPTATDREQSLAKARQLAEPISRAEQLFIEAVVERSHGDPKTASKLMSKVSKIYPDDSRPSYYAGLYYFRDLNDYAMGSEWLNRSLTSNPQFGPTLNLLGYLYLARGNLDKADDMFSRQIETIPDEPNPYDSMGDLYSKAGRHEEAVNYYAKAIALDSTFVLSHRNIGINLVWSHRAEQGRMAIMKSIELAQTSQEVIAGHSAIVRSYLYEGNVRAALGAAESAIKKASDYRYSGDLINLYLWHAAIANRLEMTAVAAADIERARTAILSSKFPGREKARWFLELLYAESQHASVQGDFSVAQELSADLQADLAKFDDGGDMSLYYLASGKIDLLQHNYKSAVAQLNRADLDDPYCIYQLGLAHEGAGNNDQANDLFARVATWNRDGQSYSMVRTNSLRKADE